MLSSLLAFVVTLCCLVVTNVLLYVVCCSVQGRLQAVLRLCLLYVDTVAIGAWFVPSLRSARRRIRFKNKKEEEIKEKGQKTKVCSGKSNVLAGN